MGPFLGFLTVLFIVMSSTRKGVKIFLEKVLIRNKKKEVKTSLDLELLLTLQKYHRYFGIGALLSALLHAALQFSITGAPSLTGGTMVGLLVVQGVTGYLQENKKGNLKVLNAIHAIIPPVLIFLIVLHIIFNSTFIAGLGIGG
jgi:p-aminobenzoyl-glutamate transporter AbgT